MKEGKLIGVAHLKENLWILDSSPFIPSDNLPIMAANPSMAVARRSRRKSARKTVTVPAVQRGLLPEPAAAGNSAHILVGPRVR